MKNWLARLFGATAHSPQTQPANPAAAAATGVANPSPSLDLDLAFYRWLGGGAAHAAPAPEQALREGDRLAKLRLLQGAGIDGTPDMAASLPAAQARIFDKLHTRED